MDNIRNEYEEWKNKVREDWKERMKIEIGEEIRKEAKGAENRSRVEFEVKLEQIWEQIIGCDIFPILDISTTFRRVTSQDISRIIEKYKHDFEICGYDDTLHELKMLLVLKISSSS